MSARPWSGRLALGGGGLKKGSLARVAGEQPPVEADGEGVIWKLVHEHGTPEVVRPFAGGRELQLEPLEGDGAVVAHGTFVLAREHEAEVDTEHPQEGAAGLGRLDRKAPVEVGDERGGEEEISRRVVGDASHAELLRQAALERAEVAFTASPGLGRAGPNVADAECLEGPRDLRVIRVVGWPAGGGGPAEVAAAVGVELGGPPIVSQERVEGMERRGGPLLRPQARVKH